MGGPDPDGTAMFLICKRQTVLTLVNRRMLPNYGLDRRAAKPYSGRADGEAPQFPFGLKPKVPDFVAEDRAETLDRNDGKHEQGRCTRPVESGLRMHGVAQRRRPVDRGDRAAGEPCLRAEVHAVPVNSGPCFAFRGQRAADGAADQ